MVEFVVRVNQQRTAYIPRAKRMVSAGMLEHGMEQVSTEKRNVWVKWYTPTRLGRWFILFLKPPGEIPSDLARKTHRGTLPSLFLQHRGGLREIWNQH